MTATVELVQGATTYTLSGDGAAIAGCSYFPGSDRLAIEQARAELRSGGLIDRPVTETCSVVLTGTAAAIRAARDNEDEGSAAKNVFGMLLKNIDVARTGGSPLCQDTGTNIYHVHIPTGVSLRKLKHLIESATAAAAAQSLLRPNAVDSVTGKNTGNNVGKQQPFIQFEEWDRDAIEFALMLKGGGCENVSAQYKLPDADWTPAAIWRVFTKSL